MKRSWGVKGMRREGAWEEKDEEQETVGMRRSST